MTDDLLYNVTVSIDSHSDIEKIEERLEDVLMDLYDTDGVESIVVVDKTPPIDEDVDEVLDVIDSVENQDIRHAINLVRALEELE